MTIKELGCVIGAVEIILRLRVFAKQMSFHNGHISIANLTYRVNSSGEKNEMLADGIL